MAPSIEQIEHSFGATHPGVYDAAKHLFALHFRGLSFYFPVDSKLQPDYAHGLGSLHFPNGASPVVSKMGLYCGGNISESKPPPLPLSCYNQQLYLESASIMRNASGTRGLRLQLFTEGSVRVLEPRKQSLTREILFGDSCQGIIHWTVVCGFALKENFFISVDVVSNLGSPNRVFFKSEDKMKIHSPSSHRRVQTKRSDFFFNYFTLGLDILFDARTQRCKKIILHTNYPGHYNFNMYHRCEFQLQLAADKWVDSFQCNTDNNVSNVSVRHRLIDGDNEKQSVIVSAYSKWDSISSRLAPAERPVVLHRAGSTNTANPFGSTFCYGYQDIIFEVITICCREIWIRWI